MIVRNSNKSIISEFRESRGQFAEAPKYVPAPPSRKRRESTPYDGFIKKYNDLENQIDNMGTRDLVYYFREIAEENGHKYTISNIKKDMAIAKRLREHYSNKEICGMIEFLYESGQDYLEKDRLSINLLASQWVNTIYADMQLWLDDKYVPKSKKSKKTYDKSREWDNSKQLPSDSTFVGNWDI